MKIIKLIIVLFCVILINLFSDNKLTKVDASNIGTSNENISVDININFDDIEYPSYVEELDYIELMSVNDINSFNNWINLENINTNLIYLRYGASVNDKDTWENKNLKFKYIVY